MSSTRQEWYEEYPEPDVPVPSLQTLNGIGIQITSYAQQFGKSLDLASRKLQHLSAHMTRSDYTLVPPRIAEPSETIRERALRLSQQPHSFAQDPHDFHFDHRGRRRY